MTDLHCPDGEKIVDALQSLQWRPMGHDRLWDDGMILLVAVPVGKPDDFHYEYSVVQIHCDEDDFTVSCEGEVWGWNLGDCDWYVLIRE